MYKKYIFAALLCAAGLFGQTPNPYYVDLGSSSDPCGPATDSTAYTIPSSVVGTLDPNLRYGNIFTCTIPVTAPGIYIVTLSFVEPCALTNPCAAFTPSVGARVFSVSINSQLVLLNYDIIKDVGPLVQVMKSFLIYARDFPLKVTFTTTTRAAVVSAMAATALGVQLGNPQ